MKSSRIAAWEGRRTMSVVHPGYYARALAEAKRLESDARAGQAAKQPSTTDDIEAAPRPSAADAAQFADFAREVEAEKRRDEEARQASEEAKKASKLRTSAQDWAAFAREVESRADHAPAPAPARAPEAMPEAPRSDEAPKQDDKSSAWAQMARAVEEKQPAARVEPEREPEPERSTGVQRFGSIGSIESRLRAYRDAAKAATAAPKPSEAEDSERREPKSSKSAADWAAFARELEDSKRREEEAIARRSSSRTPPPPDVAAAKQQTDKAREADPTAKTERHTGIDQKMREYAEAARAATAAKKSSEGEQRPAAEAPEQPKRATPDWSTFAKELEESKRLEEQALARRSAKSPAPPAQPAQPSSDSDFASFARAVDAPRAAEPAEAPKVAEPEKRPEEEKPSVGRIEQRMRQYQEAAKAGAEVRRTASPFHDRTRSEAHIAAAKHTDWLAFARELEESKRREEAAREEAARAKRSTPVVPEAKEAAEQPRAATESKWSQFAHEVEVVADTKPVASSAANDNKGDAPAQAATADSRDVGTPENSESQVQRSEAEAPKVESPKKRPAVDWFAFAMQVEKMSEDRTANVRLASPRDVHEGEPKPDEGLLAKKRLEEEIELVKQREREHGHTSAHH
eukprot:m51a1_g2666 hypothetical protein (632) ;mRNA; r:704775-706670